jgi:hypothetical protein
VITVSGTSLLARTRCGRSQGSHREISGGNVDARPRKARLQLDRWEAKPTTGRFGAEAPVIPEELVASRHPMRPIGDRHRPAGRSHAGHRRSPYLFRFTTSTDTSKASSADDGSGRVRAKRSSSQRQFGDVCGWIASGSTCHIDGLVVRAEGVVLLASRLPTAVAVRRSRRSRSMVNASRGKS